MVFASPVFLFAFMPVVVLLCIIARAAGKATVRNVLLLLFSLLFYAWGEPVYVLLMIGAILVNYFLGRFVREKKSVFVLAVALNLGMLAVFKYLDMFISGANWIFRAELPLAGLALPIGISFYTFQMISYLIDVRRGNVPAERNFVDFAAYVSMFPQLIAGPIVRYVDVKNELGIAKMDIMSAAAGVRRFCVGLAKKVLIANTAAQVADQAFEMAGSLSFAAAWLGVIAYAIQIYFDFSGYSDMAIGLGHMLGFRFMENFNYPYISQTVREFWRRWHLSLSTWFRDYLYIPLGGSRNGRLRTFRNLLIVFVLCGMWHGASWSFALWGLWHGLFLCIERIPVIQKIQQKMPGWVNWLYTIIVVLFGWILFRADDLGMAARYVSDLFTIEGVWVTEVVNLQGWLAIGLGALFSIKLPRPKLNGFTETIYTIAAFVLLAVCAVYLAGGTYNPFIYFRF
ncbi:MAG: MBOAT family protein [Clostridia bacterium]|nr:MBOAT family protein [Clostridia bacterium]